jgi:hypothetical protein
MGYQENPSDVRGFQEIFSVKYSFKDLSHERSECPPKGEVNLWYWNRENLSNASASVPLLCVCIDSTHAQRSYMIFSVSD